MSGTVFAAVLFAAVLHASWNALVKGSADKSVGVLGMAIGHLPFAALALLVVPWPDARALPWVLSGGLIHTGYCLFLASAYRRGDLSHVYPIARGVAPLIVTLVSIVFLGTVLEGGQLLGIAAIVIGLASFALVRERDGGRGEDGSGRSSASGSSDGPGASGASSNVGDTGAHGGTGGAATGLALATGGFIAAYSLNDGIGARASGGSPLGYYALVSVVNVLTLLPVLIRRDPTVLARTLAVPKQVLITGAGSFAAYGIVVWAFTEAPIPLVTALRETSIVFAVLIGVLVMHERLSLGRLAATFVTLAGAAAIRLAR